MTEVELLGWHTTGPCTSLNGECNHEWLRLGAVLGADGKPKHYRKCRLCGLLEQRKQCFGGSLEIVGEAKRVTQEKFQLEFPWWISLEIVEMMKEQREKK